MKKQISSHAAAAKAIRKELKAAFPGTKFSVTAQTFSMGDSVHISWTNSICEDKVTSIVDKYQYGSFNGMEDIYENDNDRKDISQVKFVQTNRKISDEVYEKFFKEAKETFAFFEGIKSLDDFIEEVRFSARQYVRKEYISGKDLMGF